MRDGVAVSAYRHRFQRPGEPRALGEHLAAVIADLGGPTSAPGVELFGQWGELVGPDISAHAWPVAVEGDRLLVACDDPAWATQLRWLGPELLAAIAAAGGPLLGEIVVAVRPGGRRR